MTDSDENLDHSRAIVKQSDIVLLSLSTIIRPIVVTLDTSYFTKLLVFFDPHILCTKSTWKEHRERADIELMGVSICNLLRDQSMQGKLYFHDQVYFARVARC